MRLYKLFLVALLLLPSLGHSQNRVLDKENKEKFEAELQVETILAERGVMFMSTADYELAVELLFELAEQEIQADRRHSRAEREFEDRWLTHLWYVICRDEHKIDKEEAYIEGLERAHRITRRMIRNLEKLLKQHRKLKPQCKWDGRFRIQIGETTYTLRNRRTTKR